MPRRASPSAGPGPFLKWAGGKRGLIETFEGFLPTSLEQRGYVEPFLGSGALFFHVRQHLAPRRCTLLDANAELVNVFIRVRDDLEDLICLLEEHERRHNEPGITEEACLRYYLHVREESPLPGSLDAAARFIYLNRTCFNGLYRVNSKGRFNVPMGRYVTPTILHEALLRAASKCLKGVRIEVADFRRLESYVDRGDFVYLDPPYAPLSATSSFTAYSAENFRSEDQRDLRDCVEALSSRCQWMLSNSAAPLIEDLYARPGMFKYKVMARRAINSVGASRGPVEEFVITNYKLENRDPD